MDIPRKTSAYSLKTFMRTLFTVFSLYEVRKKNLVNHRIQESYFEVDLISNRPQGPMIRL